ncbi:hypothetical protein ADL06_32970 [Streptomyces sp. NRRL F-6491]|nr:hypothetical protein ADL06_32970 [Streptomyces sp. NRRL F-6491]KOX36136.1 hypothetical protein ADL08_33770 [Streptomyces sp. NRRL F-6492]
MRAGSLDEVFRLFHLTHSRPWSTPVERSPTAMKDRVMVLSSTTSIARIGKRTTQYQCGSFRQWFMSAMFPPRRDNLLCASTRAHPRLPARSRSRSASFADLRPPPVFVEFPRRFGVRRAEAAPVSFVRVSASPRTGRTASSAGPPRPDRRSRITPA